MDVLIACEESQTVCKAFRKRGANAFSCDIVNCSGGIPEWHIKSNVIPLLGGGDFTTQDGKAHTVKKWDIIISHPPCTYLTITGNRWFDVKKYGDKAIKRFGEREKAINFFLEFTKADCECIAIENPIGCMSKIYKEPTQIIQPYQFGDRERKSTCLWLKGLCRLKPTKIVKPSIVKLKNCTMSALHYETYNLTKAERSRERSKTFPGIADAMAEQWSDFWQWKNE